MARSGFVRLLATGGTIATVTTSSGRTSPEVAAERLAAWVAATDVPVRAEQISQTPSWALGPAEMWALATRARDAAREPGCLGVVVTHGTSTLEYSAFFADLAHDGDPPIVFTGAMRRFDDPHSDGPGNLLAAVRVASAPDARGRGALACFAGDVLAARDVWKAERDAERAFLGLGGPVGTVIGTDVRFTRRTPRTRVFSGSIEAHVALVKAYPGADGSAIDAAVAAGTRGLVIEGMPGAGGIPPAMRDRLAAAVDRCSLVVLTSRAPFGRLPDAGGGTGSPLTGLALASAGDLTAEKAWVLACVVLGGAHSQAKRRFEEVSLA